MPKGPPAAFSSHAKKRNNLGLNQKERLDLRVEEKDDVTIATKWATM